MFEFAQAVSGLATPMPAVLASRDRMAVRRRILGYGFFLVVSEKSQEHQGDARSE
jgi:hypothetical protein